MKIHKKTFQIFYDVYDESYESLLNRSDGKHLRYLATEVYKSLSPKNPQIQVKSWGIMGNFSERNHIPHNLRHGDLLLLPPAKSSRYGVNSLAFRGSLLRNNPPSQVNESQTLKFKNRNKNLRSIHCTCIVCR